MTEDTVRQALEAAGNNITQAAALLGISRQSLYRLMDKFGIIVKKVAA